MKKFLLITVITLGLGLGVFLFMSNMQKAPSTNTDNKPVTNQTDTINTNEPNSNSSTAGKYIEYSEQAVNSAPEAQKIVLFFHAPWCPTCRQLENDINNNLGDIPEDVTIMKVDYDSASELKKRYGVRVQHTLVQIDHHGEMVSSWHGSSSLDSILSKVS